MFRVTRPARPLGLVDRAGWTLTLSGLLGRGHQWPARAPGSSQLGSAAGTALGVYHALGALARAGHTYPGSVSRWLLPCAWERPDVVVNVNAGGMILMDVVGYADVDLLEKLHQALEDVEDRPVELDPADAVIAEKLLQGRLRDATLEKKAELRADLGVRLARAGRFRSARDATTQAVADYADLMMAKPAEFRARYSKVHLQLSDQLGELGQLGPALKHAVTAERLAREHAQTVNASPEGDLGVTLIGVGRRRAMAGENRKALETAAEAVSLLEPAAGANPSAYRSDLAEALVSLSDRQSESGKGEGALATAQRAVKLCELLSETNPRAYAPRLAAALLALGRRHAETGEVTAALQHIEQSVREQSVRMYQELARASSLRYEPLLAEAETYHAVALLADRRPREARAAVVSAIARLRVEDPDTHETQLAWSLVQLGRILVGLGSTPDVSAPLHEALAIYQRLPSARSKRDSDAIADAQDLLRVG